MRERPDNATITKWWKDVLKRDEIGRNSNEAYLDAYNRVLRCVFCNRDLESALRESIKSSTKRSANVAYWADDDDWVFATGLYCVGHEHGCYAIANRVGVLRDVAAEHFGGARLAIRGLAARALDQEKWEPTALRRLVLIFAALSTLPASKIPEPHL